MAATFQGHQPPHWGDSAVVSSQPIQGLSKPCGQGFLPAVGMEEGRQGARG